MKLFGLVSVLIVIVLGVLFVVNAPEKVDIEQDYNDSQSTLHEDAVDSAQEVVDSGAAGSGTTVSIYDGISYPEGVKIVDVSGKGLTGSLKAEIRHLTQVEVLDMSNNNLTGIPAEIGQLSKLKILNLSHNPFTGLPHELGTLQNLEILDLTETDYATQDLETIKESLPSTVDIITD